MTAPALVSTPEEKRRLGHTHAAVAVDMESATMAQVCQRFELPFGCVRAISDEVDTPLSPCLVSLLSGGRVAPFRLARSVVRSPGLLGELWRLRRHTTTAAQQLAKALGELLSLTVP